MRMRRWREERVMKGLKENIGEAYVPVEEGR